MNLFDFLSFLAIITLETLYHSKWTFCSTNSVRSLVIEDGYIYPPAANETLCKLSPCGLNAECLFGNPFRFCRCRCGYYGLPYKECIPIQQKESLRGIIEIFIIAENVVNFLNTEDLYKAIYSLSEMKWDTNAGKFKQFMRGSIYVDKVRYAFWKFFISYLKFSVLNSFHAEKATVEEVSLYSIFTRVVHALE